LLIFSAIQLTVLVACDTLATAELVRVDGFK